MKKILPLVFAFFLLTGSLVANEAITVDRVNFNSLRNDWIQMEVRLRCNANPSPEARHSRFVENIRIKVYIAFERDAEARLFDYYASEVEIVAMKQNDRSNVYFYLPGPIVERDRLRKDPDFFYVEISVNDELQAPQRDAMSRSIPNLEILESFISNANSGSVENEDLLMPIYLVPEVDRGRIGDLPVFLRRDGNR